MVSARLSHDLRSALSALFALDAAGTQMDQQKKSHDFLMHLQSKNTRRKFQSVRQSRQDSTDRNDTQSAVETGLSSELLGSSWLACLGLLCQSDAHPAERLFCAQTLSHRLRRVKLCEAIDWEMEALTVVEASHLCLEKMTNLYISFARAIDPSLASILTELIPNPASELDEDQVKGHLSLATLGWVTVQLAHLPTTQHTQPLLTTLGAALATIALRLRYTPRSIAQNQPSSQLPIVQMVLRSLSNSNHTNSVSLEMCYCFCLGAVPDTLLGSPGGARGRLSVDPRCLSAAHEELRNPATGIHLVWQCLQQTNNPVLLWTCERWAKFLPLPWEFLKPTLGFAKEFFARDRLALGYVIAIMESGGLTEQQILSFSMGLSCDQQGHQLSRKRQSSKSKKRQKEKLQAGSTEFKLNQAEQECHHRGLMACQSLVLIWPKLQMLLRETSSSDAGGEGPLGCLCACASSCLPYVVRHEAGLSPETVISLCKTFEEICGHPDRNVRGLTYEPLCNLHAAVMATKTVSPDLETIIVDHMHQCALRLIPSCAYTPTYFHDMCADNDEEVEIERNDVRDVLRAISGNGGDCYSGPPVRLPWLVLDKILRSCGEALTSELGANELPNETLIHAISALAKPLNQLAEGYARNELPSPEAVVTLRNAFSGIRLVSERLCDAVPNLPPPQTLAVSRLQCLSTASLAPSFAFVCKKSEAQSLVDDPRLWNEMNSALTSGIQAAALSTLHIPELAAASTLGQTQYDIVGAMRSPGGEDHVGVLVFMRLAAEGDELSRRVLRLGQENKSNLLLFLCNLHDKLKAIENGRGPGVHHGAGVCPRTRRILVETITSFVRVSKQSAASFSEEATMAESLLNQLFQSAIDAVCHIDAVNLDALAYFQICEATFDVASFSSDLISGLSSERFVSTLAEAGISGYRQLRFVEIQDDRILQWGRLRAALTTLLRESAHPDLPIYAGRLTKALVQAECEAIIRQCDAGPNSESSIFNERIVSESMVSAGSFISAISQILEKSSKGADPSISICIETLVGVREQVYLALHHDCSEPLNGQLIDPRLTLCESWFLALNHLAVIQQRKPTSWNLLCETCCVAILLLLYPSLNKDTSKRMFDKGMSMDGPHVFAMLQFLENCLRLGPRFVDEVSSLLESQLRMEMQVSGKRGAIIGAALLRAASGGLPPWAVEGIPSVFAGLYSGCGDDVGQFGCLLQAAMLVRLPIDSKRVGGVDPGSLLAGRFFEQLKDAAKREFVEKSIEVCVSDCPETWRRFKSVLKHACGGKKKQSGFNLKPSPTCWECDRV